MTWGLEVANVIARSEAKELVTAAQSGSFISLLEGLSIEVDADTFTYVLSDTLQLSRAGLIFGALHVVIRLQVQPELMRRAEKTRETKRCVRTDAAGLKRRAALRPVRAPRAHPRAFTV
jgi:hypothetical protein